MSSWMFNYFLVLAVVFVKFNYGYNVPRINNGVLTPPNLFQFVVRTVDGGCTGTVISKRHVLTAAHCVYAKEDFIKHERYKEVEHFFHTYFRAGVEQINYTMKSSSKAYEPITWHSWGADIAIIEYEEGTNLGLPPVKLPTDFIEKDGDEAYIAGFGGWWEKGKDNSGGSEFLRHAKVTLKTNFFKTFLITCGNSTYHALPGDSGGPLLIYRNNQRFQIGVSHGSTVEIDYRTRVSSYCNFIEEVTKGEAKCESIYPENYLNDQMLPIKHFEPIYKGQSTPLNLFNFVVPLYNYYYNQGCTATVISKRHLLTAAWCVFRNGSSDENNKVHLTEYSSYNTITGKLFPDFRSKDIQPKLKNDPIDDVTAYFPLNYVWPWNHNLAVIEFPENVDFGVEPVTLAKDYFQTYLGEIIVAGYGSYEFKSNMHSEGTQPEFDHSNGTFEIDSATKWKIKLKDNDMFLKLMKDEGGPTLVDRNGKFYQIGVNFCSGTPNGSSTIVSEDCDFIEKVTKKEVTCESSLTVYEKPFSSESAMPENQNKPFATPLIEKPSSIAPKMIQFYYAPLFSAFLVLLYICN